MGKDKFAKKKSEIFICRPLLYVCSLSIYSLFQKKHTFNSEFFCGPPEGGGPNIHMVDYVNGASTHVNFLPPSTRGATKKFGVKCAFLLEQTVLFFIYFLLYYVCLFTTYYSVKWDNSARCVVIIHLTKVLIFNYLMSNQMPQSTQISGMRVGN